MDISQLAFSLFESLDDMAVGSLCPNLVSSSPRPCSGVRDEEQNFLDLAAVRFSHVAVNLATRSDRMRAACRTLGVFVAQQMEGWRNWRERHAGATAR